MDRKTLIAKLAKCQYNPIQDVKALEAFSDEGLSALETHCETQSSAFKAVHDEMEDVRGQLKAAQEKIRETEKNLRAAEAEVRKAKKPSEEDWLAVAPPAIRALLDRQKAQDNARRDELVESLKTAQSEYSEEELTAMEIPQLEKLAKIAKLVEEPKDFSGRETVRLRGAEKDNVFLNPPNPYAEGLKRMREGTKATAS